MAPMKGGRKSSSDMCGVFRLSFHARAKSVLCWGLPILILFLCVPKSLLVNSVDTRDRQLSPLDVRRFFQPASMALKVVVTCVDSQQAKRKWNERKSVPNASLSQGYSPLSSNSPLESHVMMESLLVFQNSASKRSESTETIRLRHLFRHGYGYGYGCGYQYEIVASSLVLLTPLSLIGWLRMIRLQDDTEFLLSFLPVDKFSQCDGVGLLAYFHNTGVTRISDVWLCAVHYIENVHALILFSILPNTCYLLT